MSFRRWKKVDLTTLQKDIAALNDLPVPDLVENYDFIMRAVADKHAPIQNKLVISAAFDTVDHETTAALFESDFGVANQAFLWIKTFLSGGKQCVVVEQKQSRDFDVVTGIPQVSRLGPILFIIYASRLFHVVKKHLPDIQCYADDTQLYLSFKPDSTISQDEAVSSMERCISDIRAVMTNNYLKLNDTKTEFLLIGSRQQLTKIKIDGIRVGSTELQTHLDSVNHFCMVYQSVK